MIRLQRNLDSLKTLGVDVVVFNPVDRPRGRPRILKGIIRYLTITLQVLLAKADIYHFFNVPDVVGLPLILKRGVKVYDVRAPWAAVLQETFGPSLLTRFAEFIERFMTRKANHIVCVNNVLAKRAVRWGGSSVRVVPNYPAADFGPTRERSEFRKSIGLEESPTVLYLGKLSKVEGINLLMDIVLNTCKKNSAIKFLVVGSGPGEEGFRAFIKREGIENRVLMTGWVPHEDVANYIEAADLCLLPRKHDSCSAFIAPESIWKAGEYLALGKPIVAPRMGGFADAPYPVMAVEPTDMATTIVEFFENPKPKVDAHHPRWPESHRRLKRLYEMLGAI